MGKQEIKRTHKTDKAIVEIVYGRGYYRVLITNGYSRVTEMKVEDTKKLIEALKKEVNSLF